MPGQVPLSNAKFINSPDFNNQAIQGITGSGVFRQFNYLNTGSSRVITSSDLWTIIELTGNSVVTVPSSGISANVGDEILFVNLTGIISFSGNILYTGLYATPPRRPARLVYAGSDYWILAGDKTGFYSGGLTDCCGNAQPTAYWFGNNVFESSTIYSNPYGTALYNVTALGGVVSYSGDIYTIVNGVVTASECSAVSYTIPYTLYDNATPTTYYSYQDVDINNNTAIIGLPFRYSQNSETYPCDTSAINGTYYRSYDGYDASNPVCFSNGVIISATDCGV